MNKPVIRKYSCDVLCIGGSGAAVSAAYMSAAAGKSVILMSKGKAGRSGNAIMVGGGFGIDGYSSKYVLGEPDANEAYTPEKLMERIIQHSFYLSDQKLARQFVTDAAPMMKVFLQWAKDAGQTMLFSPKGGLYAVSGSCIGKTIARGIREIPNMTALSDVMAIDLVKDGERVAGAVGLDLYTGEYVHVEAGATVLATGGYQPYTLKNTISEATGDGMGMALRAGAQVADMEFLLYIPTAVEPSAMRGSIIPYLFTIPIFMPLSFRVVDGSGKELRLPPPFDQVPGSNKAMKLIYSSFWSLGSDADVMHGGLYFDYSRHTDEEIVEAFDHFLAHYGHWHPKGKYNGYDMIALRDELRRTKRIQFALGNEYSNGGVVVDEKMSAGIPGLYAAGETTSGLFGAFRAGDGLAEMLAHGYRAGISAAEYVQSAGAPGHTDKAAMEIVKSVEDVLSQTGNVRSETLLRRVHRSADAGFGVIRNEDGLNQTLKELEDIAGDIAGITIPDKDRRYNLDLCHYLELRNLLLCVKAGVLAARERKESRGTHIRSDYPQVKNDQYLCRICASLENGRMLQTTIKPDTGEMQPPNENYADIHEYLAGIMS